jgi:hypothetical protein
MKHCLLVNVHVIIICQLVFAKEIHKIINRCIITDGDIRIKCLLIARQALDAGELILQGRIGGHHQGFHGKVIQPLWFCGPLAYYKPFLSYFSGNCLSLITP